MYNEELTLHNYASHASLHQHVLPYSPLWKRAVAWNRSRHASAYGIVWGDAQVGHLELCPST